MGIFQGFGSCFATVFAVLFAYFNYRTVKELRIQNELLSRPILKVELCSFEIDEMPSSFIRFASINAIQTAQQDWESIATKAGIPKTTIPKQLVLSIQNEGNSGVEELEFQIKITFRHHTSTPSDTFNCDPVVRTQTIKSKCSIPKDGKTYYINLGQLHCYSNVEIVVEDVSYCGVLDTKHKLDSAQICTLVDERAIPASVLRAIDDAQSIANGPRSAETIFKTK
jgi:hypothetical protein